MCNIEYRSYTLLDDGASNLVEDTFRFNPSFLKHP